MSHHLTTTTSPLTTDNTVSALTGESYTRRRHPPALPARLYLALGVEAGLVSGVLAFYFAAVQAWPDAFAEAWLSFWGRMQVMQGLTLALAGASAVLAVHCLRRGWRHPAMLLLTATILYGMVLLGALAGGQMGIAQVAQTFTEQLQAQPTRAPLVADVPTTQVPAVHLADAQRGARAYIASCAACHGREAEGIRGIGLPLRDTPFMQNAPEDTLRKVIVDGRTPDHPDSQLRMLMPARGGNPYLGNDTVEDIIAYLQQINTGQMGEDVVANIDPSELASGTVLPLAATGPPGLATESHHQAPPPPLLVSREGERIRSMLRLTLLGMLVLHIVIALGITARLLAFAWVRRRDRVAAALCQAVRVYWLTGLGAWVVLLPLLHHGV